MLVEDDDRFANVAPMLFGDGFEKTMKDRARRGNEVHQKVVERTPK